jgi:hypothetical protein
MRLRHVSKSGDRLQYPASMTYGGDAYVPEALGRKPEQEPKEAQGPFQSKGMCLAEFTVHSKLKPKASTEQTVDLPHVTS